MGAAELLFQRGLPKDYRSSAALLYDEAFGPKLSVAVKPGAVCLSLLEDSIVPAYAIVALTPNELVGLAGFHTPDGSFTGGLLSGDQAYRYLTSHLGFLRGTWAALILDLYERHAAPGELLMDGIAVRSDFRGQGIGGRLLDEIVAYAGDNGFDSHRLDVIDTNERAKGLYERKGFTPVKTEEFPYLRWLLGFGGSSVMQRAVD